MPKVLIIEDDKKIALALSVRLKAKGYEVSIAQDSVTGLNMATRQRPDIVLLDITMPGGGGFLVAERMQNLAGTVGTPVIFLTASKDPSFRKRADELGAAAYIEKPYEPEELLSTIERVLGGSTAPGA